MNNMGRKVGIWEYVGFKGILPVWRASDAVMPEWTITPAWADPRDGDAFRRLRHAIANEWPTGSYWERWFLRTLHYEPVKWLRSGWVRLRRRDGHPVFPDSVWVGPRGRLADGRMEPVPDRLVKLWWLFVWRHREQLPQRAKFAEIVKKYNDLSTTDNPYWLDFFRREVHCG